MKFIIISGLSGSGKSIALNVLEDSGYYCIDNLPIALLEAFFAQLDTCVPANKAALVLDTRNNEKALNKLPEILKEINNKHSIDILFLHSDDLILINRFSDTRRKHPLTTNQVTLAEAIKQERKRLEPLIDAATWVLDSSQTNVHQLRKLIKSRIDETSEHFSLLFESFGFKYGNPKDADFIFDARCLPNPHWEKELQSYTGNDQEIIHFLDKQPNVVEMRQQILNYLDNWIPCFKNNNRSYLTIAIGCTGGQHRSVYLINHLANYFRQHYANVTIRHRELGTID